jgi:DNA polymerase III delta prime subunit
MPVSVPVLLITGPVGVGKTTVAAEAARLLREADIAHALVDLAWIEQCWPVSADDSWNERLTHRNLPCMWANFQQAGAARLIVVRVLETRSLLQRVAEVLGRYSRIAGQALKPTSEHARQLISMRAVNALNSA